MASFHNHFIPQEIVNELFDLLPRNDILSLSLTSKSFRHACELILYQKIHIAPHRTGSRYSCHEKIEHISGSPYHYLDDDVVLTFLPIELLVRTLLSRPELSSYIRTVKLELIIRDCRNGNGISWSTRDLTFSEREMQAAKLLIRQQGSDYNTKEWLEALRSGHFDAILAIFSCQIQHIHNLEFTFRQKKAHPRTAPDSTQSSLPHSISVLRCFDHGLSTQKNPMIRQAQTVESVQWFVRDCVKDDSTDWWGFDELLLLLYSSRLRSLVIELCEPLTPFSWPLEAPPDPTLLQSFVLYSSCISEESLGEIISVMPNLKKLECQLFVHLHYSKGCLKYFDLSALSRSLLKGSKTLQSLILSLSFRYDYNDYLLQQSRCIGENGEDCAIRGVLDLSELENRSLKHLQVPWCAILGFDELDPGVHLDKNLPTNLESLVLTDDLMDFWACAWNKNHYRPPFQDETWDHYRVTSMLHQRQRNELETYIWKCHESSQLKSVLLHAGPIDFHRESFDESLPDALTTSRVKVEFSGSKADFRRKY